MDHKRKNKKQTNIILFVDIFKMAQLQRPPFFSCLSTTDWECMFFFVFFLFLVALKIITVTFPHYYRSLDAGSVFIGLICS